jgi:bacterioferritin-associated ferredoxin
MSNILDRSAIEAAFIVKPDDDTILCRCEEVTKGEIRRAIYDGMYSMTEVRRFLRTGMGLCQGQTCQRLVKGLLISELKSYGIDVDVQDTWVSRAPMRPVSMEVLASTTIEAVQINEYTAGDSAGDLAGAFVDNQKDNRSEKVNIKYNRTLDGHIKSGCLSKLIESEATA